MSDAKEAPVSVPVEVNWRKFAIELGDLADSLQAELAEERAKVQRLEAALKEIADMTPGDPDCNKFIDRAEAALERGESL